jgi:putative ABC transport system permease protein
VADGRLFTQEEVDGAGKVALLGQTVAGNLFADGDPLGQVIRIKNVPFTVIGLLERKGQTTFGQDQDDTVLIPLSTAKRKVLGVSQANARSVGSIAVKVGEARAMTEVLQSQEASSRVLTLLLAAIASVSLLVGGIGIMNIMLVSVTERTREIGLRMAVGARGRDILLQFLVEAVTLSLIGGAIGITVGLAGSSAVAYFARWRTLVSPEAVVLAFGFAAAVGVFFGFYPARKAAALNPIDALSYE